MRCPECHEELSVKAERCSACGAAIAPSSVLSIHVGGEVDDSESPDSSRPASSGLAVGRFELGEIVDGRYRVLGRAGAGGMGEVLRAEDTRLGHVVALKFLPEGATGDQVLRDRLLEEVRMARQVTHPNVCRVHDIGEVHGQLYLSMEFVDGEDLATLLKRIGRLPEDKALEIGRQLCAGLAAAHARGILHRDLKPANVMLDGEGRARITDFGLAVAGAADGREAMAGTPQYMAPEQLEGREATIRSDLYALGLVLYELFTGSRPHKGKSPRELLQERRTSDVAPASTVVRDIDPQVERVIQQCLESNPAARPASVLAVAASLPGGDSLEAKLAAGETPSPELVAAAGGVGTLAFKRGAIYAALVIVLAVTLAAVNRTALLIEREKPGQAPEVLVHQAQELLSTLGFSREYNDSAYGVGSNFNFAAHIRNSDESVDRWDRLAEVDLPSSVLFWYRESPYRLDPEDARGRVWERDPKLDVPGMVSVILSPNGQLVSLQAVPASDVDHDYDGTSVDWNLLFSASGLNLGTFEEVPANYTPGDAFDELHAWTGRHPEAMEIPLRIEAAGYQGFPVRYLLMFDWAESPEPSTSMLAAVLEDVTGLLELVVLWGGVVTVIFSLRRGRGDRRGAFRVAAFVFLTVLLAWACRVHPYASSDYLLGNFFDAVGDAARKALATWIIYIALEPFVRRIWPNALVAWSRLVAGNWRDPMVGREVLVGVLLAEVVVLMMRLVRVGAGSMGFDPPMPRSSNFDTTLGLRPLLADFMDVIPGGLIAAFGIVLLLVILRYLLRSRWLALSLLLAMIVLTGPRVETGVLLVDYGQTSFFAAVFIWVILKRGLLTLAVGDAWLTICDNQPVTLDFTSWYGHVGVVFLLVAASLAFYGMRTACPAWARDVQSV